MLEPLIEAIETVKKRIGQHRQTLSENETRTRGALIDPILKALGWDPGDPALVTLEYSVGSLRADYALLDHDSEPAAVIEAKKLGSAFGDKEIEQMLVYAVRADIGYACLSDGEQWKLYSVFERGSFEEKCRLKVSIAGNPTHECAFGAAGALAAKFGVGQSEKSQYADHFQQRGDQLANRPRIDSHSAGRAVP